MLVYWICIGAMLWMLDRAVRRGRLEVLMLRTRSKLMSLREALQDALLSGAVQRNALYELIDSLFSNSAETLEYRNIFTLIAFALWEKNSPASCPVIDISEALSRPENARYRSIMDGYHKCMRDFFKERHRVIVPLGMKFIDMLERERERFERYDFKEFPQRHTRDTYGVRDSDRAVHA